MTPALDTMHAWVAQVAATGGMSEGQQDGIVALAAAAHAEAVASIAASLAFVTAALAPFGDLVLGAAELLAADLTDDLAALHDRTRTDGAEA